MSVIQPFFLREADAPLLPNGWSYLTTQDASTPLKPGKLFDKKTSAELGAVPVLSQGTDHFVGFHDEAPGVQASEQNPVVTFANHTCAIRLMTRPFSCIQNIFPKMGKPGCVDTRYFYYAVQGRVNLTDYKGHHPLFRQALIPIPPLETQRRIASILGAYDDLIEVNRRRVALLEGMARGLFVEWFVRFRFPGHDAVPIVNTPDGPLPAGWKQTVVSSAFELLRGRSYRSVELADEGGMPFVNLKCLLRDGGFKASGIKRYIGDYKPGQTVVRGDIVMGVTDMTQERRIVGRVGRIPLLDEPQAVFSMDLVKVEPAPTVDRTFLYAWLRYSDFGSKAAQHANGANVLHLSPKAIVDLPISLPDKALQTKFGLTVEPLIGLAEVVAHTERRLASARDLLLPRLISGQLSVASAERELEDAA